ncbi:CO(2)-response secreted protease-like [Cannabis sativa]|uniref:CO(2)-response secreted protease-like n=1 Tax=Cannabis sativa TaxID=3483 RepID=UPI0029CA5ED9|nr:CO(2)-response secreted protease-like [Cannabis sativa]
MTNIIVFLLPFLLLQWLLISGSPTTNQIPKHYVIYMGASTASPNVTNEDTKVADELSHLQLLSSIIPRKEKERISLIHHYHHAIRGFSAMLTDNEASLLSGHSDVVSVIEDEIVEPQTTRSWDFLEEGMQSKWGLAKPVTSNMIIGVIDSGIWPEAESFNDKGIGPIPSKWKGACERASDFNASSNCNRKLIGARFYVPDPKQAASKELTPRDSTGHGTHVASTAAGAVVPGASDMGLGSGTARGGAPSARIASYKVCYSGGCSSAGILKAIDDAINDGVDIISMSLGYSTPSSNSFLEDPLSIGAIHADQNSILPVLAAGNAGPTPSTVSHTAPWTFTVAASTIDRDLRSIIHLENGKIINALGINYSNLSRSAIYPFVIGKEAAINSSVVSIAEKCYSGSLDIKKISGSIVVCVDGGDPSRLDVVPLITSKGLIMFTGKTVLGSTSTFPSVQVNNIADYDILVNYFHSTANPTATIYPTVEVPKLYKPAPVVANFSSRGPGQFTENILKPDIMAPEMAILAAAMNTSKYVFMSGTSMACPHVSGAATFIKSVHPTWTTSMIKSALITTASAYDNTGKPIRNELNLVASPHEAGSGELNHMKALDPGLVFDTTTQDYFNFLCYYGYKEAKIKSVLKGANLFQCPKNSKPELITDINYPSISIGNLKRQQSSPTVVKRTVTNVGASTSTYTVRVNSPKGLVVKVNPDRIVFSNSLNKTSFEVSFDGKGAVSGYNFGDITWSDGLDHSVRVVYVVKVV